MPRLIRDNGLSIVLAALFVVLLAGQSVAGMHQYNEEQREHGGAVVSYGGYLATAHFGEAVFENWESEFLQMGAYILLTAFLFQRGSAESKDPDAPEDKDAALAAHRDDPDVPGPVRQGGIALALYRYSLLLAFFVLFVGSFIGHAVAGLGEYNADQVSHGEPTTTLAGYLGGSRFWFESLQNWQSEFLAVLAIVLLSVWLRADGSPESKPVWKPHRATGNS
ncbi:MAG TPA: DUF6766 family protein [Rubricoccaceae bacterium]|jgi:hypothetical protein